MLVESCSSVCRLCYSINHASVCADSVAKDSAAVGGLHTCKKPSNCVCRLCCRGKYSCGRGCRCPWCTAAASSWPSGGGRPSTMKPSTGALYTSKPRYSTASLRQQANTNPGTVQCPCDNKPLTSANPGTAQPCCNKKQAETQVQCSVFAATSRHEARYSMASSQQEASATQV